MERYLVAALACRNQGSRLYGKPLQNLDVLASTKIIDHIIYSLESLSCIDEIILGIADGVENEIYKSIANSKGIRYVVGDEHDVLSRLISCGQLTNATDIFRITSESPFLYHALVENLWELHVNEKNDATFLDEIIDGCGFEIIKLNALVKSHNNGESRHKSELCSLYIRENLKEFKVHKAAPPIELNRKDLRLTVDNPEDLALCRIIFQNFKNFSPQIPIDKIVSFLDENPNLIRMVEKYTEIGYSTMSR